MCSRYIYCSVDLFVLQMVLSKRFFMSHQRPMNLVDKWLYMQGQGNTWLPSHKQTNEQKTNMQPAGQGELLLLIPGSHPPCSFLDCTVAGWASVGGTERDADGRAVENNRRGSSPLSRWPRIQLKCSALVQLMGLHAVHISQVIAMTRDCSQCYHQQLHMHPPLWRLSSSSIR